MTKAEKASQEFYRIHSYKGFTKKILGDKIITKQIIEMTNKSTNAILYAFIFQLVIFSLVQVFELREIS